MSRRYRLVVVVGIVVVAVVVGLIPIVRPAIARFYVNRGNTWEREGEHDKAIADYTTAIHLNPELPTAFTNRGLAWCEKEEYEKAIADCSEAIRLDPHVAGVYGNRGLVQIYKGEVDRAIADCSEAIRLDPTSPIDFHNRGSAWTDVGKYDQALADFNEALRLDPKYAAALNGRAWLAGTCRDAKYRNGKKAVEDAIMACELTEWHNGSCLNSLAAAYAESGDFTNAIKWQEKAIDVAPEKQKMKLRSRLDLYKARKPYRSEPKK